MKHMRVCKKKPEDFDIGPRIHKRGEACDRCGLTYSHTYIKRHLLRCPKKEECSEKPAERPDTAEKEAQFPELLSFRARRHDDFYFEVDETPPQTQKESFLMKRKWWRKTKENLILIEVEVTQLYMCWWNLLKDIILLNVEGGKDGKVMGRKGGKVQVFARGVQL